MWKKHPPGAPNGMFHRFRNVVTWPFYRLCPFSDPIFFQMSLVAALLVTVLGNCGPPPSLPFAFPINELNQTDFKRGTSLKYDCRPGFRKTGLSTLVVCGTGDKWRHNVFCVKKMCTHPGDFPNGQVEIKTDLSFGSEIEFSCSEGYILIGSSTSHCLIKDKGVAWSDPLPECVIVKCESPPDISNGKHSAGEEDLYVYGSSVTYSCDPSFSLLGSASISCTAVNETVGVWIPNPPTCERITCPKPDVPHGIIVSGFGPTYNYKDSILFTCQKGFVLRGNSLIHCETDNNWSPLPTCELTNGCTNIPDIPHAFWIPGSRREDVYQVGTILRYQCHHGYKPATHEPTTVMCQKDFNWSPFKGCKKVCCPIPEPQNIRILQPRKTNPENGCTYSYGDTVSYSCDEDQTLSATCRPDGTWHPKTPSCPQSCNFPPNIAHGHYTKVGSSFIIREVRYECDEGYKLIGEAKLSCGPFSRWSPTVPQCKAFCLKPEVGNGKLSVDKDHYIEHENVTIHCDAGFVMLGPQNITCLENRTWYPEVPKCEWEALEGCGQVLKGRNLMHCLPRPEEVKMALEIYKLSLEIELLEFQRNKERQSLLKSSLNFSEKGGKIA